MKKIYFLTMLGFFCIACSVDKDELAMDENQIQELNATFEVEGCETIWFNYNDAGRIEVTNDSEFLYVTLVASEDFALSKTWLHIANDFDGFPTVGKGNLPLSKMEFSEGFQPEVQKYTFQIALSDHGGVVLIASNSEFTNGGGKASYWAGDQMVKFGNWSYFEYKVQDCAPPCIEAGPDNSLTMTESQAAAIPSWDEVRKLYLSLLARGVVRDGTFDPSIWDMIYQFQAQRTGDFTTTYSIGEGECADSVELTINVVPD